MNPIKISQIVLICLLGFFCAKAGFVSASVIPPSQPADTLKPCDYTNQTDCEHAYPDEQHPYIGSECDWRYESGQCWIQSCYWDLATNSCYNPATVSCSQYTNMTDCNTLPTRYGCMWYGGSCINDGYLDHCTWASSYLPNQAPCSDGAYTSGDCYISDDGTKCLSVFWLSQSTSTGCANYTDEGSCNADSSCQWSGGACSEAAPTQTEVVISSPSSGSTIIDASTTLSGRWWNIDPNAWGFVEFSFISESSMTTSENYSLAITDNNGTFSIPLSSFGITENGNWDLKVQAENSATLFMDLTPSPTYKLNFNIAGNSTPYIFTNWDTWYSQYAAGGYSIPSDFANSIVAFFQPIFVNAGNFANSSLAYFNSTNFYSKGNQLGLVFPTTQAYLNKINVFFGGFPLVVFFELATFVMLGIFIVRTIFKFIPFFG